MNIGFRYALVLLIVLVAFLFMSPSPVSPSQCRLFLSGTGALCAKLSVSIVPHPNQVFDLRYRYSAGGYIYRSIENSAERRR